MEGKDHLGDQFRCSQLGMYLHGTFDDESLEILTQAEWEKIMKKK
jgi:hypothetical protein